ncbi:MAG: acyl-CoA dehydrogenase family protein [Acidimicrobiales bacterium]
MAAVIDEAHVSQLCDQLLSELDPKATRPKEFLGRQFDLGLAWVHFPVGEGGLGASPKLQRTIAQRLQEAGAPNSAYRNPIGYGMCAPTVVVHGSPEQRRRYLRPLFTSEEIWCQLFSEPGAGSDVAGLATRAVRDGDEWVVNGQKVWTTLAHLSRWGLLLARTDPNAAKHNGITAFVIDMHQPGVEVRPLRQITGEAEFNEVYFTDARVPDAERLGEVGEGWRVGLTTLMNERVAIGAGGAPARGSGTISLAVKAWNQLPEDRRDPAHKDELMRLWVEAEVTRLTNIRAGAMRKMGTPGPEGSVGKLSFAELNKRISSFALNLMGAEAMLYGSYELVRPEIAMSFESVQKLFLRCRANSIEGGTSEIMKNILAERTLGLPGDVRADKDLPWSQVPRS